MARFWFSGEMGECSGVVYRKGRRGGSRRGVERGSPALGSRGPGVPAAGSLVDERPGQGLTAGSGLKGPALARDPGRKAMPCPDGSVS